MTSEELKEHMSRVDEISTELDAIMDKIHDYQTELDVLWDMWWKVYGKLTDMIESGKEEG